MHLACPLEKRPPFPYILRGRVPGSFILRAVYDTPVDESFSRVRLTLASLNFREFSPPPPQWPGPQMPPRLSYLLVYPVGIMIFLFRTCTLSSIVYGRCLLVGLSCKQFSKQEMLV